MKVITNTDQFELPECIVVFGNFDGVHKGHQMLINEALYKKTMFGYETAFFTFDPQPISVITGKAPTDIVFTPNEKQTVVKNMGIDHYIEFPFTMDVAKTPPEVFVEEVIANKLHAKIVIVGEDYRFGNKREGDVALLETLGKTYGFEVVAFPKLCGGDRIYSSTWLREALKSGDMISFSNISGRPYRVQGIVEHGRALGRTIGFPTANVAIAPYKLLPPNGVYASHTTVKDKLYKSITNVGVKPGTTTNEMIVETFILDFDEMIYGEEIMIELLEFIRPEVKLDSMAHLKKLIEKDMVALGTFFNDHPLIIRNVRQMKLI